MLAARGLIASDDKLEELVVIEASRVG